jgi:alanine racemase
LSLSSPATITIDLGAIRHNVGVVRRLLGPRTHLYAVVKGDAYGTGIIEAAETLIGAGADALAVGDLREAFLVRRRFPVIPILIYGTYLPRDIADLARAGIWPTLFSPESVRAALQAGEPMSVFLEVDCGFGRLGFTETEVPEALEELSSRPVIQIKGLYTHLGAVEDSEAVSVQMARFRDAGAQARRSGHPDLELMVASSRVIIGYPDLALDAVNPGRLLYGLLEPPWRNLVDTQPAFMAVSTRLIQVKNLLPGRMLGYGGAAAESAGPLRAGVAVLGFAAGLPRTMAGAPVLIRGRRAAVLGLASMEHLLIDLSPVPDAAVGDEVILIGKQGAQEITGLEFSAAVGLTELEALPRLGRGLRRLFLRDGVPAQARTDLSNE